MASYIPVFFDWIETTEALNDQEKGRLIDALVLYARGGEWQDRIKGNERFVFPAFRKLIDRSAEVSAKRKVAGAAGGKATQLNAEYFKWKQNKAYESKTEQKEASPTEEEYKEEE